MGRQTHPPQEAEIKPEGNEIFVPRLQQVAPFLEEEFLMKVVKAEPKACAGQTMTTAAQCAELDSVHVTLLQRAVTCMPSASTGF